MSQKSPSGFYRWNKRSKSNKVLFYLHYIIYGVIPGLATIPLIMDFDQGWEISMVLISLAYILIVLRFELETFPFANIETIGLFIPFVLGLWYARYGFVTPGGEELLTFIHVQGSILFAGIMLTVIVGFLGIGYHYSEKKPGRLIMLMTLPLFWTLYRLGGNVVDILERADQLHLWGVVQFVGMIVLVFVFHFREAQKMYKSNRI